MNIEERMKSGLYQSPSGDTLPYRIHLPEAEGEKPSGEKFPLLLFLHGMGSVGNDNKLQIQTTPPRILDYASARGMRLILVAPQSPCAWVDTDWRLPLHHMSKKTGKPIRLLTGLLEQCIRELPVDPDRVYVTGNSMGGFASWEMLQRKGKLFASALIVCGGGDPALAARLAKIPVWCTHGDADQTVLPERSRQMRDAVNAAGGHLILTEFPGVGHDAWTPTYSNPAFLDWLFSFRRRHRPRRQSA